MADDREKHPRRGSMSDAERAEIGAPHRARTRTPVTGVPVISGSIDNADTLPDVEDFGGYTPVEHLIAAVERDMGEPLQPETKRLAEAMWKHGKKNAERTADRILEVAAAHPADAAVVARMDKLHDKHNDLRDTVDVVLKAQGEHHVLDNERHKRLDEFVAETKADKKAGSTQRWAMVVAVAGALGTAGVALDKVSSAGGKREAVIDTLVDDAKEARAERQHLREQIGSLWLELLRVQMTRSQPGRTGAGDPP